MVTALFFFFFPIIDRSAIDSSANGTSGRYIFIVFIIFLGREDIYVDKSISSNTDITLSVMLKLNLVLKTIICDNDNPDKDHQQLIFLKLIVKW